MQGKEGEVMSEFDRLFSVLRDMPDVVSAGAEKGLRKGALRVVRTAQDKLGTYQPAVGEFPAWEKLKPESVRRKYSQKNKKAARAYLKKHGAWGAGGNDDGPLVDNGFLSKAITSDDSDIKDGVMYIGVMGGTVPNDKGSDPSVYAATHEFGDTARNIPARPYLRPALYENQEQVAEDIGQAIAEEIETIWH